VRRISAWAITHPVFPLVLFSVLCFYGIVAFIRLPVTLNPDVSAPFVSIDISQPGAAPSELETQVLQKVEGAVANVGNVKNIRSVAIEGSANTTVEFQIGTPVDRATTDVRDAVAKIRPELPQGILEPQVHRIDIDGGPIVYYAISTTGMTEEQLSWFVDDTITKRLLALSGVAQVSRSGGVTREIRVNLDPGVVACHDQDRIFRAIDHVLEIVGGRPNCLMGTGALPLETPRENIRLIRQYLDQ